MVGQWYCQSQVINNGEVFMQSSPHSGTLKIASFHWRIDVTVPDNHSDIVSALKRKTAECTGDVHWTPYRTY